MKDSEKHAAASSALRGDRAKLKAVDGLLASRGWAIIREVMDAEIMEAAMQIADNPSMSLDEINFRRGAIWAAKKMIEMPDRLRRKLDGDIALSPALRPRDEPADDLP